MDNMQGYKFISLNYLYEGLMLDKDIYDSSGNLTLLTKNTVLTQNHIQRLKQLKGLNQNIRVSMSLHKKLLENGLPHIFEQKFLEEKVGYSHAYSETADMFRNVETSGDVSYEEASDLSESLETTLESIDPALIFQCINGYNDVDEYVYRHSINVALINGLMGKWLKVAPEDISSLVLGGLMHDIGKTQLPQDILNAQRKLTAEEFEIIKKHSEYSYDLISKNKDFNERIRETALYHHEKMNGNGYPRGLVADNIPYFARITSISDVYDAMVSKRCYKKANSPFMILANLADQKFSELDMRLVELFSRMMPYELVGKTVLMEDGSCARVRHVDLDDLEYPYVEIDTNIFKVSDDNQCVSMVTDDIDFDLSSLVS